MNNLLKIHLKVLETTINRLSANYFLEKKNPDVKTTGKNVVVSMGKQGVDFYKAFASWFQGEVFKAFVIEPKGYDSYEIVSRDNVTIHYTSHPLPSVQTFEATKQVLDALDELLEDQTINLHVLVSGGASSAFALPEPGISFNEYTKIIGDALTEGFNIVELNMVRGLLDCVKAGKLAARFPENKIYTYLISDVIDDNPSVIGSGPTIPGLLPTEKVVNWVKQKLMEYSLKITFEHLHEVLLLANHLERKTEIEYFIIGTKQDLIEELSENLTNNSLDFELIKNGADTDINDLADLIKEQIKIKRKMDLPPGTHITLVLVGEPAVKIDSVHKGNGGRVSTLATYISEILNGEDTGIFIGIATDGKDGSSPDPGYIVTNKTSKHLRPLGGERRILNKQNTGGALSSLGYGIKFKQTKINLTDVYMVIL
jgi:glycerate 2-kinase